MIWLKVRKNIHGANIVIDYLEMALRKLRAICLWMRYHIRVKKLRQGKNSLRVGDVGGSAKRNNFNPS